MTADNPTDSMHDLTVTVLFARRDSIYKTIPNLDVWDIDRNALNWLGGTPVVAHPPCRAWGKLRAFANPEDGEMDLARWAVRQVRMNGGVLEHPASSLLWKDMALPAPGLCDKFDGWTLPITQSWFGHRASKLTWLYIVGTPPHEVPAIPLKLGEATYVIQSRKAGRPHVSKAEREHTPVELAIWLIETARMSTRLNPT